MDLEQKYKEETGFSVGKIHEIGTTYYSDDYVTWLEKAIDYIPCCKSLNLEVKPTFEEWLNVNFTKYDNEYYQDNGRNGIWKKHKLYELYENTTL
jgi:hypothetical protein